MRLFHFKELESGPGKVVFFPENECFTVRHCETVIFQRVLLIAFQLFDAPLAVFLLSDQQLLSFVVKYEETISKRFKVNLKQVPFECELLLFREFPFEQQEFP